MIRSRSKCVSTVAAKFLQTQNRCADVKRVQFFLTESKKKSHDAVKTNNSFEPVKMAYTSYESTDVSLDSPNSPIIIMHGLLGSKTNWNSLSKVIHNRTKRKVIAADTRNHGESPHSPHLSYHHIVEDMRLLMEDLNIPKATLLGHSMGGRAGLLFGIKYPTLVESIVSIDISPVGVGRNVAGMTEFFYAMKQVDIKSNMSLGAARKEVDKQLAKVVPDPITRQFFMTNLVEDNGRVRWRVNLDAIIENFSTEIALFPDVKGSFEGPTLFIIGGASDYVREQDHEKIREMFPQVVFETIPNAGHMVHAEKPNEFVDVFCNYLEKLKSRSS